MHVCIELASDRFAGNFRSAADAAREATARIVKCGVRGAIMMRALRRKA
jgi:hypothetical protein